MTCSERETPLASIIQRVTRKPAILGPPTFDSKHKRQYYRTRNRQTDRATEGPKTETRTNNLIDESTIIDRMLGLGLHPAMKCPPIGDTSY